MTRNPLFREKMRRRSGNGSGIGPGNGIVAATGVAHCARVLVLLVPIVLLCGCVSKADDEIQLSGGASPLADALKLGSTRECPLDEAGVLLQGNLRKATLASDGGRPILVYETGFRDSIRTLWQPLDPRGLRPAGDPLVLGIKGMTYVLDFDLTVDGLGNTWTKFLTKTPKSESMRAFVEFADHAPGAHVVRIPSPLEVRESAQQVWLVPSSAPGHAELIVRSPLETSDAPDARVSSRFIWFHVDATKGSMRRVASYEDGDADTLADLDFLLLGKDDEPVALAIAHTAGQKGTKPQFKVLVRRLFAKTHDEVIIHTSSAVLGNITAQVVASERTQRNGSSARANTVHVAWLEEASSGAYPKVSWVDARLGGTGADARKGLLQIAPVEKSFDVRTVPLFTFASQLRFRILPSKEGGLFLGLTWWANLDNNAGLVTTRFEDLARSEDLEGFAGASRHPPAKLASHSPAQRLSAMRVPVVARDSRKHEELTRDIGFDSSGRPLQMKIPAVASVFSAVGADLTNGVSARLLAVLDELPGRRASLLAFEKIAAGATPDSGQTIVFCEVPPLF